jgi:sugar/nucleoside kinase (ribokinase family)
MAKPEYVCIGTVMLDDISYPMRLEAPATLGGSAVHAAAGMRVWTDSIGIVARGSAALAPEPTARLREYGFDLRGVTQDLAQPAHAWQRFDADERRHETFQFPDAGLADLVVHPSTVPEAYLSARAFHLLVGSVEHHLALVEHLRARNDDALLLVEPYYDPIERVARDRLEMLLGRIDAFAPDVNEARAVCGSDDIPSILKHLGRAGAIVIVRMGSRGAVVYDPHTETTVEVPAIGRRVVDVTGAGNAFSGGWLVGFAADRNLQRAACQGAVSASFAIEQVGPAPLSAIDPVGRDSRLRLACQLLA